jgi:hypothetical protein
MAARTARGPRAKGPTYPIIDRPAVAAVLRDAIDSLHDGDLAAAARAVGIPNSTLLAGLLRERRGAIRHDTLLRLVKLVGPDRSVAFYAALLSRTALQMLVIYEQWALTGIIEFAYPVLATDWHPEGDDCVIDPDLIVALRAPLVEGRAQRVAEIVQRLRELFADEWEELRELLERRRISPARRVRAVFRIVEPLLDYELSGSIERGPHEMTKEELREMFQLGVDRERIMLRRASDLRRAQDRAAEQGDCESFASAMGPTYWQTRLATTRATTAVKRRRDAR